MKTAFLLDTSSSTHDSMLYRDVVEQLLIELLAAGDDVIPIAWGHCVNRKVTIQTILDIERSGGTSVLPLIDNILQAGDIYDKVVLVTDGLLGPCVLHHLRHLCKRTTLPWEFAEVHIVPPLNDENVTLCAAAPFVYGTRHIIYMHNDNGKHVVSCSNKSKADILCALGNVKTPADFDACFMDVYARVCVDTLLQPDVYDVLLSQVERHLVDIAPEMCSVDLVSDNKVKNMEYTSWVFYNALSKRIKDMFDVLRTNDGCNVTRPPITRPSIVQPDVRDIFEISDIETNVLCYLSTSDTFCATSMDPIAFLMDSAAMTWLTSRINTSHNGDALYLTTDPEYVTQTRDALARNVFGQETLPGYYGLWVLVMWVAAGSPQHLIGKFLDVLRSAKVPMSLCTSGYHPTQLVSVTDALLYVIESSRVWSVNHTWRDRLCSFLQVYEIFRDIVILDGIDVSKYNSRVEDLRLAESLKTIDDKYVFRKHVCSEFMEVYTYQSGDIVLLDGLKSDARMTLGIAKTIALLENDFKVPYLDMGVPDVVQILKVGHVYAHKENEIDYSPEDVVPICPITLRPYSDWKVKSELKWGSMTKQISAHKHALDFYLIHHRFPDINSTEDMDTFIKMLERTYVTRGCLPRGVVGIARHIFNDMHKAMETRDPLLRDPEIVVQHIKRGYDRSARLQMEKEFK